MAGRCRNKPIIYVLYIKLFSVWNCSFFIWIALIYLLFDWPSHVMSSLFWLKRPPLKDPMFFHFSVFKPAVSAERTLLCAHNSFWQMQLFYIPTSYRLSHPFTVICSAGSISWPTLQSPPMKWQTKTESSPSYFACELRDEVGRVLRVKAGQKIRWRYRSRSTVHSSFNGPYTLHVAKLQCSKLSSTFSIVNHVSPLKLLTQPNQPLTHN